MGYCGMGRKDTQEKGQIKSGAGRVMRLCTY